MLDAVFLAATVALFALVALVAKGVEKLGPPTGALAARGIPSPAAQPAAAQPTAAQPTGAQPTATRPGAAHENGDRS